jgi:hypothetical protein
VVPSISSTPGSVIGTPVCISVYFVTLYSQLSDGLKKNYNVVGIFSFLYCQGLSDVFILGLNSLLFYGKTSGKICLIPQSAKQLFSFSVILTIIKPYPCSSTINCFFNVIN